MGCAKKNTYKADYTVTAIQYDETATSILAIERLLGESVYIDDVMGFLVPSLKSITISPTNYLVKDSISGEFSVLTEEEFNKKFKEI